MAAARRPAPYSWAAAAWHARPGTSRRPDAPARKQVYGPEGWCVADVPKPGVCGCNLDGFGGLGCNLKSEMVCPNQCGGRGRCRMGFCQCDAGWWGLDCAHAAGAAAAAAPRPPFAPWLEGLAVDAWACTSRGIGCLEDMMQAADRQTTWSALGLADPNAPEWAARPAAGQPPAGQPPGGDAGDVTDDEDDPATAFRLGGGGQRGGRLGGPRPHGRSGPGGGAPAAGAGAAAGAAAPAGEQAPPGQPGGSDVAQRPGFWGVDGYDPAYLEDGPGSQERRRLLGDVYGAGGAGEPPISEAGLFTGQERRQALREQRLRQLREAGGQQRGTPFAGATAAEPPGAAGNGTGAQHGAPKVAAPGQRRPLIYVYDVPGAYVSRMLSYRLHRDSCTWRIFDPEPGNLTRTSAFPYGEQRASLLSAGALVSWRGGAAPVCVNTDHLTLARPCAPPPAAASEPVFLEMLLMSQHRCGGGF